MPQQFTMLPSDAATVRLPRRPRILDANARITWRRAERVLRMGRFVYWMNVSADLFIERSAGENGGGDWMSIDEPLHRVFNDRARDMTLDVSGRVVYEIMEEFWPQAAHDDAVPEYMRDYAEIWLSTPKVLVSNTRAEAEHATRIVGGDNVMEQLAEIRRTTDGDIGIGGATLATQVLEAGLLDELMLFTHPVILGTGRPLFDRMDAPLHLDLLEHEAYHNGVTLHRYAVTTTQ